MSNEFLDDLFGDQEGYVYAPTKKGKYWHKHFFHLPEERSKLEGHINDCTDRDVYLSPVLFTDKKIAPETFKGTNYLWTEFDGVVPENAIEPTMRVMSSNPGHEHWYWKLNKFETDVILLQDITRRIAHHYGADLSAWDYQQVLRPVDTWNHKRNKPVTLKSKTDLVYSLSDFFNVPIPPANARVELNLSQLPPRDQVLAKYKFKIDTLDLIFKDEIEKGSRSDAMARLVHDLIEAGCSNEEVYVLLEDRDNAWGKFKHRNDREKRLQGLIATIRSRKVVVTEITHGTPQVYRFQDFMATDIKLEWVIEGLLPVAGSMVIFGRPGVGKSTFSLRQMMAVSLGEDFLLWKVLRTQRTLFISLEMQHYEVKDFLEDMKIPLEKGPLLQENFFIWPIGSAYPLDTPDQQMELLKYIDLHKIELIVIDSLSLSMYGSVKDDDDIKRLNSFLNEDVRRDRKCGYVFIHHPRKQTLADPKREDDQDDLFGSQYISANAQTVMVLSQRVGSTKLKAKVLKSRHSRQMQEFELERTGDRGFKLAESSLTNKKHDDKSGAGDSKGVGRRDDGSLGALFRL